MSNPEHGRDEGGPSAGGPSAAGSSAAGPVAGDPQVRRRAARALDGALASRAPADRLLAEAGAELANRDRRLLSELVLGTLRWLARIDAVIEAASRRPLAKIDRALLAPLRLGAYQLLFLDRVPPWAAVDESVRLARRRSHRGGAGFVNAVLRRVADRPRLADWPVVADDPVVRLAVETSHPRALVERWLARFGEAAATAALHASNLPASPGLLAFTDRGGRETLARDLAAEGVSTAPSALSPLGLLATAGDPVATEAFARGDLYLQDPASQAAAWVPPPAAGERWLDLAAAPGGKSFAALAWEPGLELVAADRAPGRLGRLVANRRRLGRRLPVVVADGTRPPFAERFDRVVVDLPCTGTGTLRRHPELKWRFSQAELDRLGRQATGLLAGAADAVAPGGLLVSIVCSLEPEEGEAPAAALLAARDDFAELDLGGRLPKPLDVGIAGPGLWRVPPGSEHDGFTVRVLERRR